MMTKIVIEETRIIYRGYTEALQVKARGLSISLDFGKFQYFLKSKIGEISIVEFKNYLHNGDNFFEIYCLKGNLFEDVERYPTLDEAKQVAITYLE